MKQMISFDKFYKKYDLIGNMSTMLLQTYSDDEPNYSMLTETLEKNISKFSFFKESEKLMRDQQLQHFIKLFAEKVYQDNLFSTSAI